MTADDKFKELGYKKVKERRGKSVCYEKYIDELNFVHVIHIFRRNNTISIQSYDKELMDANYIGNVGVALDKYLLELCLKKMNEIEIENYVI